MSMYIPQSDDYDHEAQDSATVIDFEEASARITRNRIEVEWLEAEVIDVEALDWCEFEAIAGPRHKC